MPRESNDSFLETLITGLIKKVDDHNESINNKVDSKVDKLQSIISEELMSLRTDINSKISSLEDDLNLHSSRIQKVEHNWRTLTAILTLGVTCLATILTCVGHFFGIK